MKSRWSFRTAVLFTALSAVPGWADDTTTEAAIGGGIGGAVGAVVGSELGGRDGAIVGAVIGGAAGAAIATHDEAMFIEIRQQRTRQLAVRREIPLTAATVVMSSVRSAITSGL